MDEDLEFNMEVVEELAYAVVGCVYDSNQESVLVYNSQLAKDVLMSQGMDEDEAVNYIEGISEGYRCVWMYPIEVMDIEWEPEPPPKPDLKLVH